MRGIFQKRWPVRDLVGCETPRAVVQRDRYLRRVLPGIGNSSGHLKDVFGGDQKAYDAQRPVNILAARRYLDTVAIFTAGADDPGVLAGQRVPRACRRWAALLTALSPLKSTSYDPTQRPTS